MSLFSTLDGLVWRHLTNAPAFSASRLPDVPEKLSKTLKRPHLVLVGTRYQVSTKSGRIFFLFRRSVYLFFTCLCSGARKSPQKSQRFSRTVTKKNTASSVQSPLPSPPPGAASSTRNSSCPICDGMGLPPAAGGDEVVSTHTIPAKRTRTKDSAGPLELIFLVFCHMIPGMACFLDVRKIKPTGSIY